MRRETKIRKVRLGLLPVQGNRFYISAHYKPLKTSGDLLLWDGGTHTHLGTACTHPSDWDEEYPGQRKSAYSHCAGFH